MKRNIISAILALAAAGASAGDFNAAAEAIAMSSAAIKASRAALQAQVESARGENTLENPQVGFEYLWNSHSGQPDRWNLAVTQQVPMPGVWRSRSRVADTMARLAALQYSVDSLAAVVKVKELMVALVGARKELAIQTEITEHCTQLLDLYNRAWEAGEITILDRDKLRIEVMRNSAALTEAGHRVEETTEQIRALAAADLDVASLLADITEYPPAAPLQPADYYLANMRRHPTYLAAQLRSQLAERQIARAKAETYWPGLEAGYVHGFEEGVHFNGLSISVQLPFYSRRHSLQAVNSAATASMFEAVDTENALRSRVTLAYEEAEHHQASMRDYGNLLETTNHLTLLRRALDGGEMNLITYIQELNFFAEALLDYNRLQCDFHTLMVALQPFE